MEAAQEAATALKFNRTIVQLARTVIAGMRRAGVPRYNGAHLRLERDAVDWARILGGLPKYLAEYAKSFAAAGFTTGKDLYIASGLLSYNASEEMTNMLKFLRPHSKTVQVRAPPARAGRGGSVLAAGIWVRPRVPAAGGAAGCGGPHARRLAVATLQAARRGPKRCPTPRSKPRRLPSTLPPRGTRSCCTLPRHHHTRFTDHPSPPPPLPANPHLPRSTRSCTCRPPS